MRPEKISTLPLDLVRKVKKRINMVINNDL